MIINHYELLAEMYNLQQLHFGVPLGTNHYFSNGGGT